MAANGKTQFVSTHWIQTIQESMQNSTQWCMLWCLWQVCPTAEIKQIVEAVCVVMVCYIHGTPVGTSHLHERSTPHMDAAEDGQFAWIERASSIHSKPGTGLCTHSSQHTHLKNTYCCSNALQHQENHTHFIYRMTKWALRAVRISWKRPHSFSFDGQLEYIARRVCIKRMAHENANP